LCGSVVAGVGVVSTVIFIKGRSVNQDKQLSIAYSRAMPARMKHSVGVPYYQSTRHDFNEVWLAAQRGDYNAIAYLLNGDELRVFCELEVKDGFGIECTALHIAIHCGARVETILLLLEAGAYVNCFNKNGDTALDTAIERGMDITVDMLIARGARRSDEYLSCIDCDESAHADMY
jgi:hypothetical protein